MHARYSGSCYPALLLRGRIPASNKKANRRGVVKKQGNAAVKVLVHASGGGRGAQAMPARRRRGAIYDKKKGPVGGEKKKRRLETPLSAYGT